MSNIPITSLPGANPLTGEEAVPIVQAGTTKKTTTGNISALPFGSAQGSVSGISFVTVSSFTNALPSSRILSATSPVLLTDGGAGGAITIGLSFTPGTGTVTSIGLSGGTTGITVSGSPVTSNGTMTLGGILIVPSGGTGTATIGANRVLVGDTVGSSITSIANATSGYVLTSTGGASAPTFQANSAVGTVTSVGLSGGTTGLTVSGTPITSNGTMTLGGFLNGTSIATNSINFAQIQQVAGLSAVGVTGTATANMAAITGTTNQVLRVNSGGTALAFGAVNLAAAAAVTGTLPVANGGLGITSGTALNVLAFTPNGTTISSIPVVVTVKKQAFTANGTYTPSTGMLFCLAEGVGGGAGGGGVAGTATAIFIAGGGGSGAFARALLTAAQIGVSKTVTIGAAGAGGVIGPNNGSVGGDTSLGVLLVAKGGSGGVATSIAAVGLGGSGGLASGSTGDIVADGNPGGAGFYNTVNTSILLLTGPGGCSFFGGGAKSAPNAGGASPGVAAGNYGGGGSGGLVNNSIVSTNGGTGAAGVLYITEWCSQ